MRGQVLTLDVVFALFVVVSTVVFLAGFGYEYDELRVLALERKATDAVIFLYEECGGLGEGEIEGEKMRSLLGLSEAGGIEVSVWGNVWSAGEKDGLRAEKYFIAANVNQTEFEVGKVVVWE